MGKGGYNGGSTMFGPRSSWFGHGPLFPEDKPLSPEERQRRRDKNKLVRQQRKDREAEAANAAYNNRLINDPDFKKAEDARVAAQRINELQANKPVIVLTKTAGGYRRRIIRRNKGHIDG